MTEMKDDPKHPKTELNNMPLYQARWPKGKVIDGKYVPGEIGCGWRSDMVDTIALAIRMNGHVVRGYFAGML